MSMQNYMVVWKGVPQRAGQFVGYGIVAFVGKPVVKISKFANNVDEILKLLRGPAS